jgi:hypothetical protein
VTGSSAKEIIDIESRNLTTRAKSLRVTVAIHIKPFSVGRVGAMGSACV